MTAPQATPCKRVRNPQLHREAILDAALRTFAERGFEYATVREIAERAGVAHSSVLRHFGSKEQLFRMAVPGPWDVAEVAPGEPCMLPERIAAAYVGRMETLAGNDPYLALLRSAATDDCAATQIYLAMQDKSLEIYRSVSGGDAIHNQLPFLASLLIGVTFSRYVVRAGLLAEMTADQFAEHLGGSIRGVLFGTQAVQP
ncbi:hypothetical protein BWI15_01375 [Kribbella sp. ALI-6-A]|uniref:TetR/AcrR family transcriptional regulator n=1 Tax=Kribbella sp. ALI-6-A TaxID=1933817 RepID=UPI00097C8517|nr:TetR/AcrR family transcriptional regulator [Kribbella sp. ALI-6-A]ONI78546.1 hypothetical protein BWI15_01375 [Kribbella sp. ALI-6-A]